MLEWLQKIPSTSQNNGAVVEDDNCRVLWRYQRLKVSIPLTHKKNRNLRCYRCNNNHVRSGNQGEKEKKMPTEIPQMTTANHRHRVQIRAPIQIKHSFNSYKKWRENRQRRVGEWRVRLRPLKPLLKIPGSTRDPP